MKSILLVYKTKTGHTKQYADWIAEEIFCETITFEKMKTIGINNYDIIIYGAGMHAGHILGLNKFKKKVRDLPDKKIIVFATGGAPYTEKIFAKIKENNFSEKEDVAFFYFESGIKYEKMGIFNKIFMKIYSKMLQSKNNKSELEKGTSTAILTSYDHSNKEYIKPIVTYMKEFFSE